MIVDHSHLQNIFGSISVLAGAAAGAVLHASEYPDDILCALKAKAFATDSAVKASTDAVQLLGGYGYMRDYGLEKIMRDAAMLSLLPVSNARAEIMIAIAEKEKLS